MPEKAINEISADARRLYTKANEAAQRENGDYAIELFCQVLEKEPGFLECRRLLRSEQQKKAAKSGPDRVIKTPSDKPLTMKDVRLIFSRPYESCRLLQL